MTTHSMRSARGIELSKFNPSRGVKCQPRQNSGPLLRELRVALTL